MPPTASRRFAFALSSGTRASLALAAAALFWSGAFIAGRALRNDVDPAMLTLLRWSLAFLAFIPFVGAKAWRCRAVLAREWRLIVGLGVTGLAAFHTLTNLAMHTTTALNAILMLSLVPATILIGGALSGTGRPSRMQWAGTAISLVGACILITHGSLAALLGLDLVRGDLWMIVSVLLWTAYSLLLRRRPADLPPDVALMASIVPAIAVLLPVALATGGARLPAPTPFVIGAILYIAVFASLIAFSLWAYGVAAIGPERAGQYVHLMPVFGAVLSTLLLGERVVAAQLVGAAFVFAGLWAASVRPQGATSRKVTTTVARPST
ncbi:MAG: DMT family transporter [Burkholderiales bacterium]|nr:DMT family transporter [Burkholderiales bacterium]